MSSTASAVSVSKKESAPTALSSVLPVSTNVAEMLRDRVNARCIEPLSVEYSKARVKRKAVKETRKCMKNIVTDDRSGGRGGDALVCRGGRGGYGGRGGRGGRGGHTVTDRGGDRSAVSTYNEQSWFPESVQSKEENVPVTPSSDVPSGLSEEAHALLQLFFSGTVRGALVTDVQRMVAAAWKQNPELTLQILLHARDARHGKGEKATTYAALSWLRKYKPKTYLQNLLPFLKVGVFKDLLQLAKAAKKARQPSLGADAHTPVELEVLAEFLRADQQTLDDFRSKQQQQQQQNENATDGASTNMKVVSVVDSGTSSSVVVASEKKPASLSGAEDDFELVTAPHSKRQIPVVVLNASATSAAIASLPSDAETLTVELCFCIDSTGSMGPWLNVTKQSVRQLVHQLTLECANSGRRCKIRLALLAYVDYFDSPRYDRCAFTEDVDTFFVALSELHARGGADLPEDMITGLEEALKYDWSVQDDKVTKLLVLIADAPCHGALFSTWDSPESTKHLQKHPEDPQATIKKIAAMNIRFSFCRITTETDKMLEIFQGYFDDRRKRKVMNVMQLGQRVHKLLPMLIEQLTMAALGRKPVVALEGEEQKENDEVAAVANEDEDLEELVLVDDPNEPPASKKAKTAKKSKGVPQAMLSLAAKWTPTEGSHFDAPDLKFASIIAKLLFPPDVHKSSSSSSSVSSQEGGTALKTSSAKQYRQLCSSLRSELQVVEKLMCAQRWSSIDFARVPARAHKLLKKAFFKHTETTYKFFLGQVKRGEVSIKSVGLQPHELIEPYRVAEKCVVDETAELQWKAMVDKLKANLFGKSGAGTAGTQHVNLNALCILDTSGSMTWNASGINDHGNLHGGASKLDNKQSFVCPIDAGIALTLLASELCTGAFRDRALTFSDKPTWVSLLPSDTATLCERVDALYSAAGSGGSTNLSSALRLILSVAVQSRCAQTDLPRTLFVLSDMALENAVVVDDVGLNSVNLKHISDEFTAAGYEMPQIVLWNLSAAAAPATGAYGGGEAQSKMASSLVPGVKLDSESGITFMSGYSASLVELALKQEFQLQPMTLLLQAVTPYANQVHIDEAER